MPKTSNPVERARLIKIITHQYNKQPLFPAIHSDCFSSPSSKNPAEEKSSNMRLIIWPRMRHLSLPRKVADLSLRVRCRPIHSMIRSFIGLWATAEPGNSFIQFFRSLATSRPLATEVQTLGRLFPTDKLLTISNPFHHKFFRLSFSHAEDEGIN